MTLPSRDPDIPHPGKVFNEGQWRTPEAIKKKRKYRREYKARPEVRALKADRDYGRQRGGGF